MTSNTKKIIAIVGATGNQGSSVARTFASLPNWHVRAITRTPSSEKASRIAKLGCDVVQADLDDTASLSRAFDGVHAIFLNTDFWESYRSSTAADNESAKIPFEREVRHGRNAVLAAAGVQTLERLVYSALGPMNAACNGKYPTSYHWESKAAVVEFIESRPDLADRTSFIYLGAYMTNRLIAPKFDARSGEYRVVLPCEGTLRMPVIDERNSTGVFVRALVEDEGPGTKLLAYDTYGTVERSVATWSEVTGQMARVISLSVEQMHELTGVPYELLWAFPYVEEFGYMAGVSGFIEPHQLKKKVATPSFEEWLRARDVNELM